MYYSFNRGKQIYSPIKNWEGPSALSTPSKKYFGMIKQEQENHWKITTWRF